MTNETQQSAGKFYGIGVGSGDPELLTVKAIRAIEKADIIIAPKTEKKEGSVALSIANPYLRKETQIVYQVFPMIKNFSDSPEAWKKNTAEIMTYLRAGKNVAFLTLGDPMLYSTYIYIFRLLKKAAADIETIPGIPAFLAISSRLGYPIATGNDILTIIPACGPHEKIDRALKAADNAVLMKVYHDFADTAQLLKDNDLSKNAVMASRCGLEGEKIIYDLDSADTAAAINYLSTILTRRHDTDTIISDSDELSDADS